MPPRLSDQQLDATNRQLIAALQADARLSLAELGRRVGLTAPAVGERLARLEEAGLSTDEIERLSSPIGLDLGARTPEETAISIAAEIIAGRWGGTGERLAGTDGPIHRSADR